MLTSDAVERLRQASLGSVSLPQFLLAQRLVSPSALEGLLRDLSASAFVCGGCAARASFAQLQGVPTLRCPRCGEALTRSAGVESTHSATVTHTASATHAAPAGGPGTERRSVSQTHAMPSTWVGRKVGAYTIERELGRGSNGVVFLARREGLSRAFALKVLRARAGFTDDETIKRFQREADLASKLSDRAVISVYDVGRDGELYYYAMDYCPGKDLKERLREGPLPVREAVELVRELARAMHRAHEQGVVHRDLKPANVILGDDDGRPRITDFGLARGKGPTRSSLTKTGDVIGTPAYMAPEQFLGENVDRGVDIYALGGILFEVLTGQRAFDAPTAMGLAEQVLIADPRRLREIDPTMPAELEAVCLKALARERDERFATAAELEQALASFLAGARKRKASGRRRPRAAGAEPAARPARGPRLLVAGLLGLVLVGGVVVVGSRGAAPPGPAGPQEDELGRLLSYGETLAAAGVGGGAALEQLIVDAEALAAADEGRRRRVLEARDRWALALLAVDGQAPTPEALELAARVAAPQGDAAARLAAERDRQGLDEALDEAFREAYALARKPAPFAEVVAPLDSLRARLEGMPELRGRLELERLRLAQRRGQFQAVVDGVDHSRLPGALAAEAELLRGLVLWRLDREDEAIACLARLADSQPDTALGLTARANQRLFERDLPAAKQAAEQALALDPARIDAALVLPFAAPIPELAQEREGMRARMEAIHAQVRLAQEVLEQAPEHWRGYWALYRGLQQMTIQRRMFEAMRGHRGPGRGRRGPWGEELPEATAVLGEVIARTGPRPYLAAWLALCDELDGDGEYALLAALCETIAEVYPQRVEPWVYRANSLGLLDDHKGAVQAAERALSVDSSATAKFLKTRPQTFDDNFRVILSWRE